jgi:hypothetical protein
MKDCERCGQAVDGLFCSYCNKQPTWAERHPIPSHVREHLERIKAKGKTPPRMREPGEEG